MSNTTIVTRLLELVSRFEAGKLSATDLESQFEDHVSALEKIDSATVGEARDLTYRLVCADLDDGEPDAVSDTQDVLRDIRAWLAALPR